jgi:two-component system OmpR family sensor kinase
VGTSIRTRLLLSILAVSLLVAAGLSWYFLQELESYGLRKLGERLRSEAYLIASLVEELGPDGTQQLAAAMADTTLPENSRARVLDASGTTVADSADESGIGEDLSERPEIAQALDGQTAQATFEGEQGRIGLSVAAPISSGGEVVGVAYTSAETFSIWSLLRDYQSRLVVVIGLFVVLTFLLAEGLARWLSRPLRGLEVTASAFAAGDHTVRANPTGSREIRAVVTSFNTMADEVETVVRELKEEEIRKSRFVSDVSHELRTPLTAIRGTAETLLDGGVPEAEAERFLLTIVRESDRLARLADDLLTLQRIEGATGELPFGVVEMRDVVDVAIEGIAALLEQRGVDVVVKGSAPDVLGDFDRLQQVVGNLVDNSSRMMTSGGTITVELSARAGRSVVSVLDEGPGMPERDIAHVFDRFYRAQPSRDRSTGGAGLGLAIVKAIVESHAGDIHATNRPEGGCRFTFSLPSLEDPSGTRPASQTGR